MKQKTTRKKPAKSHRFRFHLLHQWLTQNFPPCKAADVGGGKGLLSFLLNQSGWKCVVIDPFEQELPRTFKDLSKTRTTLKPSERSMVERISKPFEEDMAKDFDLLIGLHAHGSNIKIINACKKYGKSFVLLPCCVVDEPIEIQSNINWMESLIDYAKSLGFDVKTDKLDFMGQNVLFYSKNNL